MKSKMQTLRKIIHSSKQIELDEDLAMVGKSEVPICSSGELPGSTSRLLSTPATSSTSSLGGSCLGSIPAAAELPMASPALGPAVAVAPPTAPRNMHSSHSPGRRPSSMGRRRSPPPTPIAELEEPELELEANKSRGRPVEMAGPIPALPTVVEAGSSFPGLRQGSSDSSDTTTDSFSSVTSSAPDTNLVVHAHTTKGQQGEGNKKARRKSRFSLLAAMEARANMIAYY